MQAFKRTKPRALADTEIQGEILDNHIIQYLYPANDMPISAPCGSIIVVDTQDRHLVSRGLYLFQIFIKKNMNSENIYMYSMRRVLSKIGGGVTLYSENPMLAPPSAQGRLPQPSSAFR